MDCAPLRSWLRFCAYFGLQADCVQKFRTLLRIIPIRIEIDSGDSLRGANQIQGGERRSSPWLLCPCGMILTRNGCRAAGAALEGWGANAPASVYRGYAMRDRAGGGGPARRRDGRRSSANGLERSTKRDPGGKGGSSTARRRGKAPLLRPRSSGGPWHGGVDEGPSRPPMAWCAGGLSISRNGSRGGSASRERGGHG